MTKDMLSQEEIDALLKGDSTTGFENDDLDRKSVV